MKYARQREPRLHFEDARLALLERLARKLRLFLDGDLVARHEHGEDGDALGLEEPAAL